MNKNDHKYESSNESDCSCSCIDENDSQKNQSIITVNTENIQEGSVIEKIRMNVWNTYIGETVGKTKCLLCENNNIQQLSFYCGYVTPKSLGGDHRIENLRPICLTCYQTLSSYDGMIYFATEVYPNSGIHNTLTKKFTKDPDFFQTSFFELMRNQIKQIDDLSDSQHIAIKQLNIDHENAIQKITEDYHKKIQELNDKHHQKQKKLKSSQQKAMDELIVENYFDIMEIMEINNVIS